MTISITDHALVRWLERFHGIDLAEYRAELIALVKPYENLTPKHVQIGALWFVFENGNLKTIVQNKPKMVSNHRNDHGNHNSTGRRGDPMPWQGVKRRRDHR